MNALLDFVLESILGIVWWILLLPVVWVAATPFILVVAGFRRPPYRFAILEMYGSVTDFWKDWGAFFVP